MRTQCEYCALEGYYGEKIYETRNWIIYLAPSQRYLGTCVVALKRSCKDLNQLKKDEWIDFGEVVVMLEKAVSKTLNPTLFNWSCFKNSAYRYKNPKPEVHWHFIPRYEKPIKFDDINFQDPDFGYIPQPVERKIPEKTHLKLKNLIQKQLIINQNIYSN